jgi:DNA helicase-2/ATP-dependent DNA helicase PcrA
LEEERRLAYVGITRAMQLLYITHAFRRTRFGQEDISEPSRFLQSLPEGALERISQAPKISVGVAPRAGGTGRYGGSYGGNGSSSWAGGGRNGSYQGRQSPGVSRQPQPAAAETSLGGFKPGDRVLHAKFGQGQVINIKNLSDDQDVTIKFQDGVVRTLSANFARLQKR